eukprot:GHVS01101229.1.p1 GENE.GHVS01101229.1~~GHVS01101229.1.p1  ORF type:complete len:219 (-),score=27.66 GHVS01101229.1:65-721(-)
MMTRRCVNSKIWASACETFCYLFYCPPSRSRGSRGYTDTEGGCGARHGKTFPKCKGCGKENHTYNKCFFNGCRCNNCRQIGRQLLHVQHRRCIAGVVKDAKGKLQVRMSPNPGGLEIRQYADRTTDQKVQSAQGVLRLLRELATHKREENKLRRDRKREEAFRKPAKQRKEHAIAMVQADQKENEEESVTQQRLKTELADLFGGSSSSSEDEGGDLQA